MMIRRLIFLYLLQKAKSLSSILIPEESNFWYSQYQSIHSDDNDSCSNAKNTRRIHLDLSHVDEETTISDCIDQNYRTFQCRNLSALQLLTETLPQSILLERCHLTVPLSLGTHNHHSNHKEARDLRNKLLWILSQSGLEHIHTLEIQMPPSNVGAATAHPLQWLERLEVLYECKRDGWIQSVSIRDSDTSNNNNKKNDNDIASQHSLLLQADSHFKDFVLYQQRPSHILNPVPNAKQPPLVIDNLFCHEWLRTTTPSGENTRAAHDPRLALRVQQQQQAVTATAWGKQRQNTDDHCDLWRAYQSQLLQPLQDLARYYSTTVESLLVQWGLQRYSGGVVVDAAIPLQRFDGVDMAALLEQLDDIVQVPMPPPDAALDDRLSLFETTDASPTLKESSSGLFLPS